MTYDLPLTAYHCLKSAVWFLTGSFCFTVAVAQTDPEATRTQKEEDFYTIHTLPIPEGISLEIGGMAFLPNDALAVATRHGEVWTITNPYMKNGSLPQYRLFAQGLHEALGLNYVGGELYVAQRPELTRLRDLDGDGEADEYRTVYAWPLAGNYHEYAYGPVLDKEGNLVVTLNLGYTTSAVSLSRWHGWMLKITPEGKPKPFATGMRSPAALALNGEGDLFYSENQGEWVGSGSITHVAEGDFLGHPAGLRWAGLPGSPVQLRPADVPNTGEPKFEVAKRVPGLKTPSVWFPQTILGISTSGILNYGDQGKMGPFEGQLFVGDQGQSKVMRVALEKVKGVYQGAVFPFREGFSSGILRLNWGSDGSMFVGMTSRGWGSTGPQPFGLQRLEWNGKTPFEIKTVKARPDGFELEFTAPVEEATARDAASYNLTGFIYKYHSAYGSATINQLRCPVKAIALSDDHTKVRLVVDSLREGYIHEIIAEGIRSADRFALLHNYGYYTLNRIPDGPKLAITNQNRVRNAVAEHHSRPPKPTTASVAATSPGGNAKHVTSQPPDWKNGPDRTVAIAPVPGLKFDTEVITVKAGTKIKLTFQNTDDMLHNVVFTTPEAADFVGAQAATMGLNGQQLDYVPPLHHVLSHTRLLQPGESDTIYFTAPDQPGDYQYVCTYPGHYLLMRGVLKVVAR
ncbi:MAG: auracyanin family protein [Ferruginibacter sp.]|nr:auracyanin family protein [Cytophagales bacterium]